MKYLRYLHPWRLYNKVVSANEAFLGLDMGDTCTGITIGKVVGPPYYKRALASAVPVLTNMSGNYSLTPLELALNAKADFSIGKVRKDVFAYTHLFPTQVLKQEMKPRVVTDVINQLAEENKVGGLVIGHNADRRYWDNEPDYVFLKDQIKLLEDEGRVVPRFFTLIDESGSTNLGRDFVSEVYPELSNVHVFMNEYPEVVELAGYKDIQSLDTDLRAFRKALVDSIAAGIFNVKYIGKCIVGRRLLKSNTQNRKKLRKMEEFAKDLGYEDDGGEF